MDIQYVIYSLYIYLCTADVWGNEKKPLQDFSRGSRRLRMLRDNVWSQTGGMLRTSCCVSSKWLHDLLSVRVCVWDLNMHPGYFGDQFPCATLEVVGSLFCALAALCFQFVLICVCLVMYSLVFLIPLFFQAVFPQTFPHADSSDIHFSFNPTPLPSPHLTLKVSSFSLGGQLWCINISLRFQLFFLWKHRTSPTNPHSF